MSEDRNIIVRPVLEDDDLTSLPEVRHLKFFAYQSYILRS